MLVDLNINFEKRHISDERYDNVMKNIGDYNADFLEFINYKMTDVVCNISKGVYQYYDCNTGFLLENLDIPYVENVYFFERNNKHFSAYGVCDNFEQIIEKNKWLENDKKNKYVIILWKVSKDTQPKDGGWRWHKWGEYIGTQESQCDYIADEPNIDFVYCYHIYKLL